MKSRIHPEDLGSFESLFDIVLSRKKNIITEFRIICRNKKIKHLSSIINTYKSPEDNSTILRGTIQDITERKIAEQKVLEIENLKSIHKKKTQRCYLFNQRKRTKKNCSRITRRYWFISHCS